MPHNRQLLDKMLHRPVMDALFNPPCMAIGDDLFLFLIAGACVFVRYR